MKTTMYGVECPKCKHVFDYTIETLPMMTEKELKKYIDKMKR